MIEGFAFRFTWLIYFQVCGGWWATMSLGVGFCGFRGLCELMGLRLKVDVSGLVYVGICVLVGWRLISV